MQYRIKLLFFYVILLIFVTWPYFSDFTSVCFFSFPAFSVDGCSQGFGVEFLLIYFTHASFGSPDFFASVNCCTYTDNSQMYLSVPVLSASCSKKTLVGFSFDWIPILWNSVWMEIIVFYADQPIPLYLHCHQLWAFLTLGIWGSISFKALH